MSQAADAAIPLRDGTKIDPASPWPLDPLRHVNPTIAAALRPHVMHLACVVDSSEFDSVVDMAASKASPRRFTGEPLTGFGDLEDLTPEQRHAETLADLRERQADHARDFGSRA